MFQLRHGRAVTASLEQPTQPLGVETCVRQDPRQGAALKLSVERHRQRDPAVGVLHADMAAALAHHLPTRAFECLDEPFAGQDR